MTNDADNGWGNCRGRGGCIVDCTPTLRALRDCDVRTTHDAMTARRRVYHDAVCTTCGCDTWAPRVRCATCNTRTMVCAACERCDDCARDVVTCAQCDDASCDVRAHDDDDDAMCDDCGTIGTAHDVDGATCYVCDDCGASWLYVQRATPRDVVTAQRDDDVPTCGDAACALWHTCAVYAALRALPTRAVLCDDVRGICAVNDADNDDTELREWAASCRACAHCDGAACRINRAATLLAQRATLCDVCDADADVCTTCHVCVTCTAHDARCADAVPCAACNGNVLAMWRAQRRDNAA